MLLGIACAKRDLDSGGGSLKEPVKIVAVGDSITQGRSKKESYRPWLAEALSEGGIDAIFVGSQAGAYDRSWSERELRHEGYWGWRADEVLGRWRGGTAFTPPDIAIVHLGHNDLGSGEAPADVVDDLRGVIAFLREISPTVSIVVMAPIPSHWVASGEFTELGDLIRDLAIELDLPSARVVSVSAAASFDPSVHTWDGVHPNMQGAQVMAASLLPAVLELATEKNPLARSDRAEALSTDLSK